MSEMQGCLGCGTSTEALSPFCPHCAESVEFEKYYRSGAKDPRKLESQKPRQCPANLLTKMIFPCPVLTATLVGIFVIAAVLCRSTSLECGLFDHCLLS